MIEQLDARHLDALEQAVHDSTGTKELWPGFNVTAQSILRAYRQWAPAILRQLQVVRNMEVTLQVCHGDPWHDHMLFTGDQLTGMIDFGNMQWESRAADIARLLGSLARDDTTAWSSGMAAYEQVVPLADAERRLVQVFDKTTVLLSGMNWLNWLLVQRRRFESSEKVSERMQEILDRLDYLGR